jgi:hypothetical protein
VGDEACEVNVEALSGDRRSVVHVVSPSRCLVAAFDGLGCGAADIAVSETTVFVTVSSLVANLIAILDVIDMALVIETTVSESSTSSRSNRTVFLRIVFVDMFTKRVKDTVNDM